MGLILHAWAWGPKVGPLFLMELYVLDWGEGGPGQLEALRVSEETDMRKPGHSMELLGPQDRSRWYPGQLARPSQFGGQWQDNCHHQSVNEVFFDLPSPSFPRWEGPRVPAPSLWHVLSHLTVLLAPTPSLSLVSPVPQFSRGFPLGRSRFLNWWQCLQHCNSCMGITHSRLSSLGLAPLGWVVGVEYVQCHPQSIPLLMTSGQGLEDRPGSQVYFFPRWPDQRPWVGGSLCPLLVKET